MGKEARRGYAPGDAAAFGGGQIVALRHAQEEICYLLSRGYGMEKAVTFVGNHRQLSARQRMALSRACTAPLALAARRQKLLEGGLGGKTVYLDGFNLVITLETALSGSTLLLCMDGVVRDLCGLHGTYRLIDKTTPAIGLLLAYLVGRQAGAAVVYLDAPVSNSGRLRERILGQAGGMPLRVELVPNADRPLWGQDCVASGDAGILDRCGGWINPVRDILAQQLPACPLVDLSGAPCGGDSPAGSRDC